MLVLAHNSHRQTISPEGSGKTGQILVLQDLLYHEPRTAFVYCNHKLLQNVDDPMEIIMAFWAGLVGDGDFQIASEDREKLLSHGKPDPDSPLSPNLRPSEEHDLKMNVICHHIAKTGPTTLILDGLDEVQPDEIATVMGDKLQRGILTRLKQIQDRTQYCRVLVASRPQCRIRACFERHWPDMQNYNIQVRELDLDKYIQYRASEADWVLMKDNDHEEAMRLVHETLLPKCQKEESFLLAKLFMDEVLRAYSLADLEQILQGLPKTVKEAYDQGLTRLSQEAPEASSDGLPCMPIQALYWVALAKRRFHVKELEQALAIQYNDKEFNVRRSIFDYQGGQIMGVERFSGMLLKVDPSDGLVSFAHQTVLEHLVETGSMNKWFPRASQHMALILMTYLSFESMQQPLESDLDEARFKERNPLLDYALSHWGAYLNGLAHAANDASLEHQTQKFLTGAAMKWSPYVNRRATEYLERLIIIFFATPDNTFNCLYWAATFNFDNRDIIKALSEFAYSQPITLSRSEISPLGLAAYLDHYDVLQHLVACGADVNGRQPNGRPSFLPLREAASNGSLMSIRILTDEGADWSLRDEWDNLPFEEILGIGNKTTAREVAGWIPQRIPVMAASLRFLIQGGFTKDLRRVLKDTCIDVNMQCENGKRALDYARELGHPEMIQILEQAGAVANLYWSASNLDEYSKRLQSLLPFQSQAPALVKEKRFGGFHVKTPKNELLNIELDENFPFPVRSIVFETVSHDGGSNGYFGVQNTYKYVMEPSFEVKINNKGNTKHFLLQNNVYNSSTPRLHTNIWTPSELEHTRPNVAQCIRDLQPGSSIHVLTNQWSTNYIEFVRVRVYTVEPCYQGYVTESSC